MNMNSSYMSETSSSMRNVIEYLINKLDARAKYMQKVKTATNSVKSFEDFLDNRLHMLKTFTEIEDDLLQGSNALKVLNVQNKDYAEQIQQLNKQIHYVESKGSIETRLVKELSDKNSQLLQEIEDLKHILDEKDAVIAELNDGFIKLEEQMQSNNFYSKGAVNSNREMQERMSKVVEENALMKLQLDAVRKKGSLDIKVEESLKNLLEEKQSSKRKINEKIKEHLSRSNTEPSQRSLSPKFSDKRRTINLQENILQRISASDELLIFVTKAYGNDFMNKLVNGECEEQLLKLVEDSLNAVEKLEGEEHRDAAYPKKGRRLTQSDFISEENEEAEQSETGRQRDMKKSPMKSNTLRSKSSSKQNVLKRSNSTNVIVKVPAKPFENNLRNYKSNLAARKFNHFSTGTSNGYFDKGLATGGYSKLDYSDTIRKRNISRKLNKSCEK
jgi:hypothetical protein